MGAAVKLLPMPEIFLQNLADTFRGVAALPAESANAQDAVSYSDSLTGLASRAGLEASLSGLEVSHAGEPISLMAVEISRFGSVNASMGSALGNKIIATIAKRIRKIFPHALSIARTHGDHFGLVFDGVVDIGEQIDLLKDFMQRPLLVNGEVVVLGVRVGVAVLGSLVGSPSQLLHAAEVALHRAKRDKVKICIYHRDMESEAKAAHQLENDLRVSLVSRHVELHKAINNNEFCIQYQPIIDVDKRSVHAVEALLRWNHPKRGLVSPAQFIPVAEQIQVMDVLGSWVIRRACLDAMSLPRNADGSQPGVSINVSPTQFIGPRLLLDTIKHALRESGIRPECVKLEVTESTAFGVEAGEIIEAIRGLGCKVALDDFGTGYSSLTQLNSIPLDYIKLDRSFIARIGCGDLVEDQRSDRMTRAVLSIADNFDLIPIVEGVETAEQYERLKKAGARFMQGYYFSRPLSLEDVCSFVGELNNQACEGQCCESL